MKHPPFTNILSGIVMNRFLISLFCLQNTCHGKKRVVSKRHEMKGGIVEQSSLDKLPFTQKSRLLLNWQNKG